MNRKPMTRVSENIFPYRIAEKSVLIMGYLQRKRDRSYTEIAQVPEKP